MAEGMETKTCSACKQTLSLEAFSVASNYADGYRGQCRKCRSAYSSAYSAKHGHKPLSGIRKPANPAANRARKLRTKYGISPEIYEQMLCNQNGGCAICATTEPYGRHNRFVVDHCHESGRVRGLLCSKCNRNLAAFGDNAAGVRRALAYLEAAEQLPIEAALAKTSVAMKNGGSPWSPRAK